jgi:hypothetical protein
MSSLTSCSTFGADEGRITLNVSAANTFARSNTEASQIAEVHLANSILQNEGRVRDSEHIVGADSTLHFPTILPLAYLLCRITPT